MKRHDQTTRLAAALIAAMTGVAGAQTFAPGDVYLVSAALPNGGSSQAGIARIEPGPYTVTQIYAGSAAQVGRATYDPWRQRIITPVLNQSQFKMIAPDGGVTSLAFPGVFGYFPTAAGDGRIYFIRQSTGVLSVIDRHGVTHDVLDQAGLASATTPFGNVWAMFFDTTTQSLLLGLNLAGGANGLEKITFAPGGLSVSSRQSITFPDGTGSELITGFTPGPNGTVFMKLDDNTNGADARMKTVDVATMTVSDFAVSNYFGAASEVAGAYMPSTGTALVIDTGNDKLRVFAPGESGAGSVVATTGVSSAGGSGEAAQFVVITDPTPHCGSADFNGDGDLGTDLDIEAFFGCLGGDCCATCGSPDFNNDGDIGTDGDIEAFFFVLGGGSC